MLCIADEDICSGVVYQLSAAYGKAACAIGTALVCGELSIYLILNRAEDREVFKACRIGLNYRGGVKVQNTRG